MIRSRRRAVFNFSPGPSTLPLEVLEEAQAELVDYRRTGMSLLEMSHRGGEYEAVHREALGLVREVSGLPDEYEVLFLQGGASLQFGMVPLNLLGPGRRAGYLVTGAWARKALEDASHHGEVYAAWARSEGAPRVPHPPEVRVEPGLRYLHLTSNETIDGVQWPDFPDLGVPLVADMSSDLLSRPIPWERFDLIYGGAQKNLGPAGLTVVFVRRAIFGECVPDLTSYLRYPVHAASDSLHNTPPVFAVWLTGKVLAWMRRNGGLPEFERRAAEKARLIYRVIDASDGFYVCPVETASRSRMNVVFRLPREEQERAFLAGAEARGLLNLKGHRSMGGIRASLYNALPLDGAEALAAWMDEFRAGAVAA